MLTKKRFAEIQTSPQLQANERLQNMVSIAREKLQSELGPMYDHVNEEWTVEYDRDRPVIMLRIHDAMGADASVAMTPEEIINRETVTRKIRQLWGNALSESTTRMWQDFHNKYSTPVGAL
jgi:hypothetical protein